MYCLKCKYKTNTENLHQRITKNNRLMLTGTCSECGSKKCQFTAKSNGGKLDIHAMIGKLPRPNAGFTLPNHKYTGPYNPLHKQLDENDQPLPGQEPYNQVDEIAMHHDICYRDNPQTKGECDQKMLNNLSEMKPKNTREKIDKALVSGIIGAKHKFGLGIKTNNDAKITWNDQLADELHKPIRKHFPKRRVLVSKIDDTWAADLVDMQKLSKYNNGYRYLLAVIDIFSKYGWLIPLKNKTGVEVERAFSGIFKERVPEKIWTDKGTEFYNKKVKDLFKKYSIELYSTNNEEKSPIVERWNRTMKNKMYKYFTANQTSKYSDVLPEMVNQYNNTKHRSIGMKPADASKPENSVTVYQNLYKDPPERSDPKFKVGDREFPRRRKRLKRVIPQIGRKSCLPLQRFKILIHPHTRYQT